MLARNHLLEYELLHSKTVLKRGNDININSNSYLKKLIKQSRSKSKLSTNSSRVILDTLSSKSSNNLLNLSKKSNNEISNEQYYYLNVNSKKESKSKNKNIIAMRKPIVYTSNENNNLNNSNIMDVNNNNNSDNNYSNNALKITVNEYDEEFEDKEFENEKNDLDEYRTYISVDVTPAPLYNLHTTRELAEFGKCTLQEVQKLTNLLNNAQTINSRLNGLGSPGGPIAREIKAPGPHNGHNPISKGDAFLNPNFDIGDEVIKLVIPYKMEQPEWIVPYGLPLTPSKFSEKKLLESTFNSTLKSSKRPSSASIPNSNYIKNNIKRPNSAALALTKQSNQSNKNSPINSPKKDKLSLSIFENTVNSLDIIGHNSQLRSIKKLKHLTENYLSHKVKNKLRPKSANVSKINQDIVYSKALKEENKSITNNLYVPKIETDLKINIKESDKIL